MSETTFEYDAFIPHPLDAVWKAMQRTDDTTVISAQEVEGGTNVHIKTTVTGGFLVRALLKLVGKAGVNKASESIVANITAICEGREPRVLSPEEINAFVKQRVSELHEADDEK